MFFVVDLSCPLAVQFALLSQPFFNDFSNFKMRMTLVSMFHNYIDRYNGAFCSNIIVKLPKHILPFECSFKIY